MATKRNPVAGMGVKELAAKKRAANPKAKPTRETFGEVVGKSIPYGKLPTYPLLKTQKARLLSGFQAIGFSKSTAASIVDSAQQRQAMRNRDGRAMFLSGADLLAAAKSHGYFDDEPSQNPAKKSARTVALVGANPKRRDDIPGDFSQSSAKVYGRAWSDAKQASLKEIGADAVVRLTWSDGEWLQMVFDSKAGALKHLSSLGFA